MAELTTRVGRRAKIGRIPDVQLDTGSGKTLISLGNTFFNLAARRRAEEDIAGEIEGKEKGAEAALRQMMSLPDGTMIPQFLRVEGTDPRTRAFNKQQLITYTALMETRIRERAIQIASKFRNDPVAMQKHFDSFLQGMIQTSPAVIQAQMARQGAALIQPHILSSTDRVLKAQAKSTAEAVNALEDGLLGDIQAMGNIIGEDGEGARGALGNVGAAVVSFIDKITQRVDGITFTAGEAAKRAQVFMSSATRRLLQGIFDGSGKKAELYQKFIRGQGTVDLPLVVTDPASGKQVLRIVNIKPEQAMTNADIQGLKTYMGGRIDEMHQQRTRARAAAEKQGMLDVNTNLAMLAKTGRIEHYDAIMQNAHATVDHINKAKEILLNRPDTTDPNYLRTVRDKILLGRVNSIDDVDWTMVSDDHREDLMDRIEKFNDANHFTRSPHYRTAEDNLKLELTGKVGQLVNNRVVGRRQASDVEEKAAASMILLLRRTAQDVINGGGVVGANKGGFAHESFDRTTQEGTEKVMRFDPVKWVEERLNRIEVSIRETNKELVELKAAADTAQEAWRVGQNTPDAKRLWEAYFPLQKRYTALRRRLRTDFITEMSTR